MRAPTGRAGGRTTALTLAAVLTALALVAGACTRDKLAAQATGPVRPASFHAFGSIGQASVTGAPAGSTIELVDAAGHVVRSARADRLGAAVFYGVSPGPGYRARRVPAAGSAQSTSTAPAAVEETPDFSVLDRDQVPDRSLYTGQTLKPGLNYVRMRDGVELAMTLRLPAGATLANGPFPTVIEYSGYEVAPPHDLLSSVIARLKDPTAPADPLVPSTATAVGSLIAPLLGFATVSVQIRGSGCSGGAFDLFGLPTVYDGYDAVETVAAQPWVTGNKVGMVGISYSGYSQLFVGGTRPPHLAALAPMSVTDDLYSGIGFPGGIPNTGFAKGWITERQHDSRPAPGGGQAWATAEIKAGDTQCLANQQLHGQAQDGLGIITRTRYKDPSLFADRTPATWAAKIDVPTFLVGGLQDEQLDSHWVEVLGALAGHPDTWVTMYNGNHNDALAPRIISRWVEFLDLFVAHKVPVIPPQVLAFSKVLYDQVDGVAAEPIPQTRFASTTDVAADLATFRRDPRIRILMDNGAGSLGAGALQPTWERTFDQWPPPGTSARRWYLGPDGQLDTATPDASTPAGRDSYLADPSARPATSQDLNAKVAPTFHDDPNDWTPLADGKGLGYTSAPLARDVFIAGTSSLDAWVSASAPDTDLQVTLSEVRPDGQEMYLQTGWLRASDRHLDAAASTATDPHPTFLRGDASPLPAGTATLVRIPIFPVVYDFRPGSRIRVSISAPGGDRPIWTFLTIDAGTTKVSVHRGADTPSALVLPVVDGQSAGGPLPACDTVRGQPCRPFVASTTGG